MFGARSAMNFDCHLWKKASFAITVFNIFPNIFLQREIGEKSFRFESGVLR